MLNKNTWGVKKCGAYKQMPLNLQWLVLRIGDANFLHC